MEIVSLDHIGMKVKPGDRVTIAAPVMNVNEPANKVTVKVGGLVTVDIDSLIACAARTPTAVPD
ncbi:hypothetical protein FJ872_30805 [Mesorhizobium sp. B2-5-9]|nr:hypothetical protein FJ872_30805 [Mesorhizobium sp. B2-5-9]